jgi:CelD/BcsL family acetyltransferase involved in cellulose biosynthesis
VTAIPVPATSVPATPFNGAVSLVSSAFGFAELRAPWAELVASCHLPSVFLTHEWFDAAWQWRQTTSHLYMLCLFRAQRLTAVLPLVLQTKKVFGMSVRELTFLTVPDTQWCDLIVSERYAADAAAAFAAELQRRSGEWDVLRLKYLPSQSVAGSAFRKALTNLRFAVRATAVPGNPYIALDTTWAEFYETRSRRLKKANNLVSNRLKRAGTIRIDWLSPDASGAAGSNDVVEQLIAISAKSWKTETGNSLDNPGPQAFIRRLSAAALDRRWLSVWLLALDDRPVAMEYQLMVDGNVFALRSDFDTELEDVSPGAFLNRHMIERLFGRGLRRYYMGPGNNAYKHRWTDQIEPVTEMTAYGRSLNGRALALWEIKIKPIMLQLRSRLRRNGGETSEGAHA